MWQKRVMFALTVVFLVAPMASGQVNDDGIPPNNVERLPESSPVLEYVLTGLFLLAALGIGFMPSKRSQEDLVLPRGGPL